MSLLVVQVAAPEPFTVTAVVQSEMVVLVVPFLPTIVKVTCPDGNTPPVEPVGVTVAVKVTDELTFEATAPVLEASVNVAASAFTVCTTCADAGDRVKLVSPP